ncbi:hypothetical protein BDN70DRAFT_907820 [Pholiota conissans]|uniref:mRNA cap guanine-N(7) methyltransferase n=1 Tax=Pholiota conissans TaxID=109636 RepID=A0A9P5YWM0_9AGAR|nr:hypothetical protein BDN70DRAFT_907820 [Pholiota conissans]
MLSSTRPRSAPPPSTAAQPISPSSSTPTTTPPPPTAPSTASPSPPPSLFLSPMPRSSAFVPTAARASPVSPESASVPPATSQSSLRSVRISAMLATLASSYSIASTRFMLSAVLDRSDLRTLSDNSRPDVGVVQRLESPIVGLENFNNWVKSVLITRFDHPVLQQSQISGPLSGSGRPQMGRGKVLDKGCGKGGDMTKWSKAHVKELIGAGGTRFDATFAAMDCYTQPLGKGFPPARLAEPFDVVSMQYCMHYASSEGLYLRPGGIFIRTIPNADLLLEHLDNIPPDAEELSFGNSVCKINFENHERPLFGHKYWFFLQDAMENIPEYVVQWETFERMAADHGLDLLYKKEFHQVFEEHQDNPEFKSLLVRMKVVDEDGASAMDEDQWEAANIYIAFAFAKRQHQRKRLFIWYRSYRRGDGLRTHAACGSGGRGGGLNKKRSDELCYYERDLASGDHSESQKESRPHRRKFGRGTD